MRRPLSKLNLLISKPLLQRRARVQNGVNVLS